jgi:phosphoenolpyruvate synthase/pyruvate phosphate dikinase
VTHCRSLAELRAQDEPRFGGKSASLGELLHAAIPAPPGFALATSAFRTFIAESGLEGRIADAMAHVSAGDVDAIGAASHSISEAMRFAPVPDEVRDEVADRYEQLAQATGVETPPVAVRSSAIGEDSQDATFAGQQETYLWVREADHVCDAIRDCWVSLYSAPAISYRARLDRADIEPAMGVTVQLMVDAAVSGVMFTCNPVSGDPSMIAINASWGLGLAVVGGEVTPDDFLVSKITREVVREHVNHKDVEYVPDPRGRGAIRHQIEDERRDSRSLDAASIDKLVDVARRIEDHFKAHQDVEFVLARDSDELYIVQSRPVTALPKREHKPPPTSAIAAVMSTFGADRTKPN